MNDNYVSFSTQRFLYFKSGFNFIKILTKNREQDVRLMKTYVVTVFIRLKFKSSEN